MNRLSCPHCGVPTLRIGAVKCPGCRAWVGPRPRAPISALVVALTVAGLAGSGLVLGAAVVIASAGSSAPGEPSPSAAPLPADSSPPLEASAAATASAAEPRPAASAAAKGPPLAPISFSEPRLVRTAVSPVDAVVADDDATLFVLGDDGSVRVHEISSGKETRKVAVTGKGTELRLLAGKVLAVLGGSGPMQLIDLSTYAVSKLDLGGSAVDIVALESVPSLVAASGASRKIARFSLSGFKPEGQVVLPRPISGLVLMRDGHEVLAALTQAGSQASPRPQSKRSGGLGTVDMFDPAASPFGATRSSWIAAVDPRRGAASQGTLYVVDRSASQLLAVSRDKPLRIANVGQRPISAHRLGGRWVVTVDATGTATVLAEDTLEKRQTLMLGAGPSDAAVTPDGRGLLIALGGGPRERGAATVLITGDPPAVTEKRETGPGAHTVRIGKSGRLAAVTAYFGRAVAILERR